MVCELTQMGVVIVIPELIVCDNGGPTVVLVCAFYTVFLLPAAGSWLAG